MASAPTLYAVGGSGAHGGLSQGAAALKGEIADSPATLAGVAFTPAQEIAAAAKDATPT